jgi:hypothetical protein
MVLMMVVWLTKKEPEGTEISDQMKSTNLGDEQYGWTGEWLSAMEALKMWIW